MTITFSLSEKQNIKLNSWLEDVKKEIAAAQQAEHPEMDEETCGVAGFFWRRGEPYGGAIGGGLTYRFTPTSIGTCVSVKYYGREFDLTEDF